MGMNYKKILSSFLITVLLINNLAFVVTPAQAETINNSGTSKPGLPACQSLSFAIAGRKEVPQARLVSNYVPETEELITLSFSPSYNENLEIGNCLKIENCELKIEKYIPLLANLTLLQSITTNNPITTNNYYLYSDHLSSTSHVYDDQGNKVESHQYTPFGSSVIARSPDPDFIEGRVLSVVEGEGGHGNPIGADDDIKSRHPEEQSDEGSPPGFSVIASPEFTCGEPVESIEGRGNPEGEEQTITGSPHPRLSVGARDDKNVTDKLYTSQTKDTSTDLYYYHARYYDPTTARFIQPDTVVSGNRYQYVGNNPVNMTDPTGKTAVIPPWLIYVLWGFFDPDQMAATGETVVGKALENIVLSDYIGSYSDGTVPLEDYTISPGDPIFDTWIRQFPELFYDLESCSELSFYLCPQKTNWGGKLPAELAVRNQPTSKSIAINTSIDAVAGELSAKAVGWLFKKGITTALRKIGGEELIKAIELTKAGEEKAAYTLAKKIAEKHGIKIYEASSTWDMAVRTGQTLTSSFNPKTNTINIHPEQLDDAAVFVHELIHGLINQRDNTLLKMATEYFAYGSYLLIDSCATGSEYLNNVVGSQIFNPDHSKLTSAFNQGLFSILEFLRADLHTKPGKLIRKNLHNLPE